MTILCLRRKIVAVLPNCPSRVVGTLPRLWRGFVLDIINLMKENIFLWGPVVVWCALIFYLSDVPQLEVTSEPVGNFLTRKLAHIVEYAVLFILILRATQFKRPRLAFALTITYAITDELHQALVPTRTAKLEDLAFDTLGALLGGAVWKYYPAVLTKLKS